MCDVVYNNHSSAPICGGYLPWSGVYFGACCAPCAISACCTCRMCCYMCVYCGAGCAPDAVSACCTCCMCWLYVCVVVLGAHVVLSVLAALGICVVYFCVLWCLEHTLCCQCLLALGIIVVYVCVLWCLECTWCCQCLQHWADLFCYKWCLERTWCCHCLLHLSYVLDICTCYGAGSAPGDVSACCTWHMCSLCVCFVVLGAHLVLSVLAALGKCVGYMYCEVLVAHLVQEGNGPCKIPNFSHLLWSYGIYMYFVRHDALTRDKVIIVEKLVVLNVKTYFIILLVYTHCNFILTCTLQ